MSVSIQKCGDELIAALAGEIDHHNAKKIREIIDAELEKGGCRLLTFDLGSVSFMDSSGIGVILGRFRVISAFGGKLRIVNANRRVERILRMAGIFSIAECCQRRA